MDEALFGLYWDLLVSGEEDWPRLSALRAFFFCGLWPGVYRVGHRRWQLG